MNIVLSGLSGVGKTYFGRLFAQEHNLTFLPFMPDLDSPDEWAIHKYVVGRQKSHNENIIYEGDIISSELVKIWMYKQGILNIKELMEIMSVDQTHVIPYGMIYLIDDMENIKAKRSKRGRKWEYFPGMTDLTSVDQFLTSNMVRYAKHRKIPITIVDIQNKSDREVLDAIENAIFKLLTNN